MNGLLKCRKTVRQLVVGLVLKQVTAIKEPKERGEESAKFYLDEGLKLALSLSIYICTVFELDSISVALYAI